MRSIAFTAGIIALLLIGLSVPVSAAVYVDLLASNITPFTLPEEYTTIQIGPTNYLNYDASLDQGLPIFAFTLDGLSEPGIYVVNLELNDGSTYEANITVDYVNLGISKTIKIEVDGTEWTKTILLPAMFPSVTGTTGWVKFAPGYDREENQWYMMAGMWPDEIIFPIDDPADNPWKKIMATGAGDFTGTIYLTDWENLETTEGYSEEGGILSWIDRIVGWSWEFLHIIRFLLEFAFYLFAHLLLVMPVLEGALFLMALDKKDIFKTIDQWFKYNKSVIGGIIWLIQGVVDVLTSIVSIFKFW